MRLTNRGKIFFTALAMIVLTVVVIVVAVSGGKSNREIQVYSCDNAEAYVYRGDKSILVTQGIQLESKDRISVKSGTVTVLVDDSTYTTLFANTDVTIEITGNSDDGNIILAVSQGSVLANIKGDIGSGKYVVNTDSASISTGSFSAMLVDVEVMTDYEATELHVLANTASLKLNATKLNAEVTQAVPSGYIMSTSKITTTGKCQIEANNLGNVDMLSKEVAKAIYDMQTQGMINTVYSQSALQGVLDNSANTEELTGDLPTDDPTNDLPTDDPTNTPPPANNDKVVINPGDSNCQHEYAKDDRQSKEVTCVADGYIYYACAKCQASYLQTVLKNEDAHDFDGGVHTAGDCTTPGYTTYKCANCQKTKVENDTTTTDHTYGSGVHTEGDCKNLGYTTYTCTKCQNKKVINDTKKGDHKYTDEHIAAGNCTEVGYTIHTCQVCDDKSVTIGEAGAHSYVDHTCQYCLTVEPGYETPETPETPEDAESMETTTGYDQ